MKSHANALRRILRPGNMVLVVVSTLLAVVGFGGVLATKYIACAGYLIVATALLSRTIIASRRGRRNYRHGWVWMTFSVLALTALGLTYGIREVWWTTNLPWVLFDAIHAVAMGSCALALVHLSSSSVRQSYRRFLDAFALGGALTMLMWSTAYGQAILRHSTLASMTKAVQMTVFFAVLFSACSVVVTSRRKTPAFLPALGWLLNFSVLIVFAVLASFDIRIYEGYVALPSVLCLVLTLASAQHSWRHPETPLQKPTSAMVANLAIVFAVVVLGYQSRETVHYTTIAIGQIALMSIVVAARNSLSSWEIRDLLRTVGERKEQLAYDANHDSLTGLVNRREFTRKVTYELQGADRGPVSIAFIDLDGFKAINDSRGHQAGDYVLRQVASALTDIMPAGSVSGRLSGDEFAVLAVGNGHDVSPVLSRFADRLKAIETSPGHRMKLTASVGIATAGPDELTSADDLIHRADLAMYVVKHDGRDGCAVHTADMTSPFLDDRLLTPAFREAVESGVVETYYQPMFDVATRQVCGFEALSRWAHNGVRISPARFIGLAERGGVIDDLTWLVVERACAQLSVWQKRYPEITLNVSVNIPGPSLANPDLLTRILHLAGTYGVNPQQLTLEVTESMPIRDIVEATQVLQEARQQGIQVSLDDFGTGCNSIAHLLQLPISKAKIDPTMVRGIEVDPERADVVAGMVALASQRGLAVVAEGVENTQQLNLLQSMGVTSVQGYLFGMPNPANYWDQLFDGSATLDQTRLGAGTEPSDTHLLVGSQHLRSTPV